MTNTLRNTCLTYLAGALLVEAIVFCQFGESRASAVYWTTIGLYGAAAGAIAIPLAFGRRRYASDAEWHIDARALLVLLRDALLPLGAVIAATSVAIGINASGPLPVLHGSLFLVLGIVEMAAVFGAVWLLFRLRITGGRARV